MDRHSRFHEPAMADGNLAASGARRGETKDCVRVGVPLESPIPCGDCWHCDQRSADSEVVSSDTPSQDIWLVRRGLLRLQRYSYEGRRQILSLFLPGEIIGYEGQLREGMSVETVTESTLCRIKRQSFEGMLSVNCRLRAELFRQKRDQLDRLHWLTWSLGALGPGERLSAFLALSSQFMPYQRLPDGSGILSMQLPRRDIADLLATTVETVSRVLHKLSDQGLVELRDPARFRLVDLEGLIALGQIKSQFDRVALGLAARRERIDLLADQAVVGRSRHFPAQGQERSVLPRLGASERKHRAAT